MLCLLWNEFQRWLNMEDQSDIFEGITDSFEMLHSSMHVMVQIACRIDVAEYRHLEYSSK